MPVFSTTCDNFTGFDGGSPYIGAGQTLAVTATGNPGNAFQYGLTTASTETAVRADYRSLNVRNIAFDIKIDSATTIATTGDHTLVHFWDDAYADFLQLRFEAQNSGTNFRLKLVDPVASYATILTVPDWLAKNTWYRLSLQITDSVIVIRIDGRLAARLTGRTQTGINLGVSAMGAFFGSILTGAMYLDNITLDVNAAPAAATTDTAKLAAVYGQYKTNILRADGCPIRNFPDGVSGTFTPWSDSTSETVSYIMLMAVQLDDKITFDAVATWAYTTMRRGAQSLTAVPNLYSWHWNIENNTAYDQNNATDGDIDIMKAYYWAHGRWGSAGTINYLTRANEVATDLLSMCVTNGSLKYLPSDYVQSVNNPFEFNPSYTDFFALALARRYHYPNEAAWGQVIDGMFALLVSSRDYIYAPETTSSGLPPNWCNVSTTGTITAGGRSNPGVYSYEAFRLMYRVKEYHDEYADARSISLLATAKTFFINYWNANAVIKAEYNHDGSVFGNYEKAIFTYAAVQSMTINDAANATASAIYTAKLASLYAATVEGHIYQDAPASANYAYYDSSWLIFDELARQNAIKNYLDAGANLLAMV